MTDIDIDLKSFYDFHFKEAIEHLKMCELSVQSKLADLTASICDVEKEKIFTDTDIIYIAHARWFYWFSYRYMTNESYEKISMQTINGGHTFNPRTVQSGVSKMTMMIAGEPLWAKRWLVIKNIIKTFNGNNIKKDEPLVIQIPKEFKNKIQINYK